MFANAKEMKEHVKKAHKGDFSAFGEELKKMGATQFQKAYKALGLTPEKDKATTIKKIIQKIQGNGEKVEQSTIQKGKEKGLNPLLLVDEHFKDMVPRPTEEDYKRTKESIKAKGMYEKIKVLPDGRIVDGFTRFQILGELGIEITWDMVEEVDLKTDEEIERYMVIENIERRHLTDVEKIAIAKKYISSIKEERKQEKKEVEAKAKEAGTKPAKVKPTRVKVAEKAGVSEAQVQRQEFLEKYAPELLKEVEAKKTTLGDAYFKATDWWKAVKKFSQKAESEEDKALFSEVQKGDKDLKEAWDYVQENTVEEPKEHVPGPMEKLASDIFGIYNKILLQKYDGKQDFVADKWEGQFIERLSAMIDKFADKNK